MYVDDEAEAYRQTGDRLTRNRNTPLTRGAALEAAVRTQIGSRLRATYLFLTSQPAPERFKRLIEQLLEQEKPSGGESDGSEGDGRSPPDRTGGTR